ncbi:MAG: hypothetical protein J6B89_01590 [Bacilli bacterium]|nr:hypothetical protein [Bacilli bacterium]
MKKKWVFLVLFFIVLNFALPENVSAKEVLQKCIYNANEGLVEQNNDISNSSYYIYIYSDNSIRGVFDSWKGKSRNNEDNLINWKEIKSNAKSDDGSSANCPTHVIMSKPSHLGGNFRAWGAYSEEDAKKLFDKNKNKGWGTVDAGIVKVTKSFNKEGIASSGDTGSTSNSHLPETAPPDEQQKCSYILGDPSTEGTIAWMLQKILNYIKVLGPILVIVLSTLDFTKTIMTSDAKEMKKAQSKLFIRIGCAVGLFFLPLIATVLINIINGTTGDQACGLK